MLFRLVRAAFVAISAGLVPQSFFNLQCMAYSSTAISMIYQCGSIGIHRWHRTHGGKLLQQLEKYEMFVWFTNITVLPDEDLGVKRLHLGCAHK